MDGRSNGVRAVWSATPTATSYDLLRAAHGSPPAPYQTNVTSPYLDGAATPGSLFDYAIVANNAAGPSLPSDTDNAGVSDLMVGMLAFWPCDEVSGNASDVFNGNDLVNVGGVTYAAGKLNNAAVIDGSGSQYLSCAVPSGVTTECTIAFWVKFNSLSGNAGVFSLGSGSEFFLARAGNNFNCGFGGLGNFGQSNAPGFFNMTSWAHVAIVFNGNLSGNSSRLKIWVNGTQYSFGGGFGGTIPASISPAGTLFFGFEPTVYSASLDGMIDEIGLWNVALTDAQIKALVLFGAPAEFPWGWYDHHAVLVLDQFVDPNGTEILDHAPAPVNPDTLAWAGDGDVANFVIQSNILTENSGYAVALLDPGVEDFDLTYFGSKGTDPTYSAVEIVARWGSLGDTLWFHCKFNGDFELLTRFGTGSTDYSLLAPGSWGFSPDNADHQFVLKKRGDEFSGWCDGLQRWIVSTALHAGNTALGFAQALPGSAATGATCNSFEVRTGEQFPPYPLVEF